jgi:hypothetical protein
MELSEDFKILVFKYGIEAVINYSEIFVKENYQEIERVYSKLFNSKITSVEAQNIQISPIECIQAEVKEVVKTEVKVETETKTEPDVKQVVKVVEETEQTNDEPVKKAPKKCEKKVRPETAPQQTNEEPKNNQENTIGNVETKVEETGHVEMSEAEKKKQEKEAEKERKKEEKREQNRIAKQKLTAAQNKTAERNKAAGKNPYDMLTKENLTNWIINEERSYAEIAKNIVGCSDKEVSLAARRFEVKSIYTGVNGMAKAGRRRKPKVDVKKEE